MKALNGLAAVSALSAMALLAAPPSEARVRVTTASDNGGPAPGLLFCVNSAIAPDDDAGVEIATDFHAWLFVTKLDGAPAAPHAIHLFLTVDASEREPDRERIGIPLRLASWRSFQGDATDPELCASIAAAIRRGVAGAGPGFRSIRSE